MNKGNGRASNGKGVAGWETKRLGDVCNVEKRQNNGQLLPYIGLEHIESQTGTFIGSTDPTSVKSSTFTFSPAHVLYGRLRPYLNKVYLPDFKGHCSTEIFPIKPSDILSKTFLQYWLMRGKTVVQINATCTGTRMPRANMNAVLDFEFPLPPLPEQRRIVAILDEAFAGLASARVNAERNLKSARDLFESHLEKVFSERGEGWVETTLGEAFDVRDGTHDSPKYHEKGYPLVTSKNLKREGLSFDKVKFICEQDYIQINKRSAVHKGDVLFAMIGTIGNPVVVTRGPAFAIKNVALLKVREQQSSDFLAYYLQSPFVVSKMARESRGTTQKFVSLAYLRNFPIALPSFGDQLAISKGIRMVRGELVTLEALYQRKIAAIDELKASLLDRAFSGRL